MPEALPPEEDKPGVPLAPPLLFAIPLAVALALEFFRPTMLGLGLARLPLGLVLAAVGLALNVGGARAQLRAGTNFLPERPSTAIVIAGPYRFTRNPMYLGFTALTGSIAVVADSWWAVAAVPLGVLLMDRIIIVREERYLERKFGETYLAYKRGVRRWL